MNIMSKISNYLKIFMALLALFIVTNIIYSQENNNIANNYSFEVVSISPSPFGEYYEGIFSLINHSKKELSIPYTEELDDTKISVWNHRFQIFENGKWIDCEANSTSFHVLHKKISPDKKYQIFADIYIEKRNAPTIVRIGFNGEGSIWSKPFTLDWNKDKLNGQFELANSKYLEKLKSALRIAGFNDRILSNENLCGQIYKDMLSITPLDFRQKVADINIDHATIPKIKLNGDLEIFIRLYQRDNENAESIGSIYVFVAPSKLNLTDYNKDKDESVSVRARKSEKEITVTIDKRGKKFEKIINIEIVFANDNTIPNEQLEKIGNNCVLQLDAVINNWLKK
jgi:hypothetical protein